MSHTRGRPRKDPEPDDFGPTGPALLTIDQAARYLGVSGHTIRRWVVNEGLPHLDVGGDFRIPRRALDKWVVERTI